MLPFPSANDDDDDDDVESTEIDERLAALVANLADRHQKGDSIDIVEECQRYPEFAAELKSLGAQSSLPRPSALSKRALSDSGKTLARELGNSLFLTSLVTLSYRPC